MGQLSTRIDLPFPIFDADNHLYEPPEAMTKYLPKEYKDIVQYVQVNGRTKIALRGQISNYIPNPTFEVVAKPGAWEEYFKYGNPEGKSKRELFGEPMRAIPAFFEPGPRLEVMDSLGLDRTLMFPTMASVVEERLRDDPVAIHVIIHALNEWLADVWGFNYENRIYTTPVALTVPAFCAWRWGLQGAAWGIAGSVWWNNIWWWRSYGLAARRFTRERLAAPSDDPVPT